MKSPSPTATFRRFALFTLASLASTAVLQAAESDPLGQFDNQTDIGAVHVPGSATYDAKSQTYTIESSGTNMWTDHDEFHLVWKKITGDFIVQAQVELIGDKGDPHRKSGIIVRSSLDPRPSFDRRAGVGQRADFGLDDAGATQRARFSFTPRSSVGTRTRCH